MNWPMAITVLGGLVAFLSFIFKMLNKDISLEDVKRYKELNDKIERVNILFQENKKDIDILTETQKKDVEALKETSNEIKGNMRNLLDKLIDLIKTTK